MYNEALKMSKKNLNIPMSVILLNDIEKKANEAGLKTATYARIVLAKHVETSFLDISEKPVDLEEYAA